MNEKRDSDTRPAVSIVIPVRNEAGNITPLIAEITAALGSSVAFEIIYVNDGSTDRTESELTLLMASRPWLRHIIHRTSCGQSAAVRTGVRGTPTLFVNGEQYDGDVSADALLAALESQARPA